MFFSLMKTDLLRNRGNKKDSSGKVILCYRPEQEENTKRRKRDYINNQRFIAILFHISPEHIWIYRLFATQHNMLCQRLQIQKHNTFSGTNKKSDLKI